MADSSAAASLAVSSSAVLNSTLPLWMYVLTPVCPSEVTTSRRSAIGTLFRPPTLMPRSSATCDAMASFSPGQYFRAP